MTGTQIIAKFNLQVDDSSELSDTEALDLANDVYQEVQDDRAWEWLKATGTGNTSASLPYVALASDFKMLVPNYGDGIAGNYAVVFVGTERTPYRVVSYQDRHLYRDQDGYCYIDVPNSRVVFTLQPSSVKAIEYDYIKVATALTTSTSPLFRSGFHKIIAFGMAAKFNPIEQTNKADSYQKENQQAYVDILADMAMEDVQLKLGIS